MGSWKLRAKCKGSKDPRWLNPSLIQVPVGNDPLQWRSLVAAGMCSGCPVIEQCRRDIIDNADQDQIKGGYCLGTRNGTVSTRQEEQYNVIRGDLGIEREPTRVDYLKQFYPAPCVNPGCDNIIRIPPMRKFDFPDTVVGVLENGLCVMCHKENKDA